MAKKNISRERIIQAFLDSAFEKGSGATSLSDIADILEIKKASLYNHFESKEEMYKATLEYCCNEMYFVSEEIGKIIKNINSGKSTPSVYFKKYINRYYNLYEADPLFNVYIFLYSEQFFNYEAFRILNKEKERLEKELFIILKTFMDNGKIKSFADKELRECSQIIGSRILEQLNFYLAKRKEVVRQNPESGVGSLFALPADDNTINGVVKSIDFILKEISVDKQE